MRTVAIVNQKGGCGKTTTAINLAGVFASQGHRVLLVDMDPQSHCAAGLGIPEKRIDLDITDALSPGGSLDLSKLIWKPSRNLDLIPSRMRLAGLEAARGGLADQGDRHIRLSNVLSRVADQYDICLIDCSPAIGLLTYNALAASNTVLIPVETSFFSLQGAARQVSTVRSMAKHLSLTLRTWLVATLHDPASGLATDLFDELRRRFGDAVCPHTIRHDVRLREAASLGKTIIQYAPESMGADDYSVLAGWLKPKLHSRIPDPAPALESPADLDPLSGSLAGIVQVMSSVQTAGLTQKLSGRGAEHASLASAIDAGDPPSPHAPHVPHPVGVAEQIAADLRARAATRSEEMARLAQKLARAQAAPAAAATAPDAAPAAASTGVEPAHNLTLLPEIKPGSAARPPVNLFMGVRQTRQGSLFILPLTLGNTVSIAGDFNAWSVQRHVMKRNEELGVFELCIPLPPGRYTYRIVVDGLWQTDPFNPVTEPNPFGEANSIVAVSAGE